MRSWAGIAVCGDGSGKELFFIDDEDVKYDQHGHTSFPFFDGGFM